MEIVDNIIRIIITFLSIHIFFESVIMEEMATPPIKIRVQSDHKIFFSTNFPSIPPVLS